MVAGGVYEVGCFEVGCFEVGRFGGGLGREVRAAALSQGLG